MPTADGTIWYPVGVFTTTGFSWRSAAVVPVSCAGFEKVTNRFVPPVDSVTGETVPLILIEIAVAVKLTE